MDSSTFTPYIPPKSEWKHFGINAYLIVVSFALLFIDISVIVYYHEEGISNWYSWNTILSVVAPVASMIVAFIAMFGAPDQRRRLNPAIQTKLDIVLLFVSIANMIGSVLGIHSIRMAGKHVDPRSYVAIVFTCSFLIVAVYMIYEDADAEYRRTVIQYAVAQWSTKWSAAKVRWNGTTRLVGIVFCASIGHVKEWGASIRAGFLTGIRASFWTTYSFTTGAARNGDMIGDAWEMDGWVPNIIQSARNYR